MNWTELKQFTVDGEFKCGTLGSFYIPEYSILGSLYLENVK